MPLAQPPAGNTEEFDELLRGGFSKEKVTSFFERRPLLVARRIVEIGRVFWKIKGVWDDPDREAQRGEELRKGLLTLGPVFVKVGQTLAQRPDLIGETVAEELKSLQVAATPFDDEVAHQIILEDLDHRGPLAPGICPEGCDPALPPLFEAFSGSPVAAASLGQVYKARSHDGVVMAVKVQRPGTARAVALDWACLRFITSVYRAARAAVNDFTVLADQVAIGVFLELDYHNEAENMEEFNELHKWLGFVTAPRWLRKYTGPKGTARVLSTEWVDGHRFQDLPKPLRRRAVRMATEACLVQLLITGFVHADPHEGNILYTEDGRVAFLDFGLVDRVAPQQMQAFAEGMKSIVQQNWTDVAVQLRELKWTTEPIKRNLRPGQVAPKFVNASFEEFVEALATEFREDEEARRRLGATVAAVRRLSDRFLMITPPYIVLITRTFVTLEGLVERVDPGFNIYTMALPVTLRRFVSPATPPAQQALRQSVLTADGEIKWAQLEAMLNSSGVVSQSRAGGGRVAEERPEGSGDSFKPMQGLLGSSAGNTLRRLAYDVDAGKLLRYLASPRAGRRWRWRASAWLAERWEQAWSSRGGKRRPGQASSAEEPTLEFGSGSAAAVEFRSEQDQRLRADWRRRRRKAFGVIAWSHVSRGGLLLGGISLVVASALLLRVASGAALLIFVRRLRLACRGAASGARLAIQAVRTPGGVRGAIRAALVLAVAALAPVDRRLRRARKERAAMPLGRSSKAASLNVVGELDKGSAE